MRSFRMIATASWAAAADGSLAMGLATVPCERSETYETGGFVVVETPELGRLAHEHVCGRLAEARNASQDVEALAQVRVCIAQHLRCLSIASI